MTLLLAQEMPQRQGTTTASFDLGRLADNVADQSLDIPDTLAVTKA
jgi:hypothetical protein